MIRPSMSVSIAAAATLLLPPVAAVLAADANAPSPAGSALTRARLDDVVTQLRANGLRWQKGLPLEPGPEAALKALFFEPHNVGLLSDVIVNTPTDPNGLYVAARLLRQLTYSRPETIRAALPAVKGLCGRVSKMYKPFPPLSDHELRYLKEPTDQSPAAKAALKRRQDAKIARETPIARVNEAVFTIQGRTYQLMALSHDPDEYEELADKLIATEKDRSGVFLIVVQAIAAEARRMSPDEARVLYDILRPAAIELKMERKRSYANFSRPILKPDDVSTYETSDLYPGITVLKMLNRVATACRSASAPALKVPKPRELEKYWRDKQRAAKRKGRR